MQGIRLEKRIFNAQFLQFPLFMRTRGNYLRMRGAHAHTARGIRQAIRQIRILEAPRHQLRLNRFSSFKELPGQHSSSANNTLRDIRPQYGRENPEFAPGVQFALLGRLDFIPKAHLVLCR